MKNRVSVFNYIFCLLLCHVIDAQELNTDVHFKSHCYIPAYGIKKIGNPNWFQGNRKQKKYFEGWYFKMVSADGAAILSVIPGISLSQHGEQQHAFIQIIDGKTAETSYYTYPIEDFTFSKKEFAIRIGDNYFSQDKLILNLKDDSTSIAGLVTMSDQVYLSPNNKKKIMGWYRFVPFMQCYHGVVSLNHSLEGTLVKDNISYDFSNGVGYIEKDWGKSMPSEWIWMQTNSFTAENSSFMLSVATIPWLGSSFTGFLGFFLHDGKVQRFGTYTHAKLYREPSHSDTIKLSITNKNYTYLIETHRSQAGMLKAPVHGSMDRRIAESIDAKLLLTVMDKAGTVIFNDSTSIAGLETVGDVVLPMCDAD